MPVYQKFNHNATSNSYFGKYDNIIEREVLLCVGTGLIVTCGVQLYHRERGVIDRIGVFFMISHFVDYDLSNDISQSISILNGCYCLYWDFAIVILTAEQLEIGS